jgi:uncharacterized membrane protein
MARPIEVVQMAFEAVGVLALLLGAAVASAGYIATLARRQAGGRAAFVTLRQRLGNAILIGLEFLVAADIIRSVALDLTFTSIGILGLLVLIRTFLSWSLQVEIEGRWPWSSAPTP